MDKNYLLNLEFEKILKKFSMYSMCVENRRKYENFQIEDDFFFQDEDSLNLFLDQVDRVLKIVEEQGVENFEFCDLRFLFENDFKILDIEELTLIFRFVKEYNTLRATNFPQTQGVSLFFLKNEMEKYLDANGLDEDKIPSIKAIKSEMDSIKEEIKIELKEIIKKDKDKYEIQQPKMIDSRSVLLLKSSEKNYEKGFFLSASNTGSSIYFEPYSINKLNNSIIQKESLYKKEVYKIIENLSKRVYQELKNLKEAYSFVLETDKVYSRAVFAKEYKLKRIEIADCIKLFSARNLLIEKDCVPIDLNIESDTKLVILSGVNAGGKTAFLKTLGLTSLMLSSGFFCPCEDGSMLKLFKKVFLEIGDQQSIQSFLSSFTSHLIGLKNILNNADKDSLVLIDEICSSTSPKEGGCIAMAFCDKMLDTGAFSMISTHYDSLKTYAFSKDGVQNASVLFDEETQSPLYQIKIGSLSSSYAIKIAAKLGFDPIIIESAKKYLEEEGIEIEKITANLLKKQEDLEEELKLIKEVQENIQKEKYTLDKMKRELEDKEESLREKELYVKKLLVQEYKEKIKEQRIEVLKKEEKEIEEELLQIEEQKDEKLKNIIFKQGDEVVIKQSGKIGEVLSINKDGTYTILVGIIRIDLKKHELEKHEKEIEKPSYKPSYAVDFKRNLDLRGMTLEEGIKALQKNIDAALAKNIKKFSVIHGKGSGVLLNGIHSFLKHENEIKEFFFANEDDGGFGKTYIIMK